MQGSTSKGQPSIMARQRSSRSTNQHNRQWRFLSQIMQAKPSAAAGRLEYTRFSQSASQDARRHDANKRPQQPRHIWPPNTISDVVPVGTQTILKCWTAPILSPKPKMVSAPALAGSYTTQLLLANSSCQEKGQAMASRGTLSHQGLCDLRS
jgi:hypothetical protein